MTEPSNKNTASNKSLLIQYASIGTQLFAGIFIFVFAGKWLDAKLHLSFPLLIWLLPLIFIIGMMIKVIKETSKKKDG
jgi:F0F1-type ATP synthase assembly protein I